MSSGYRSVRIVNHPLADCQGIVRVHRVVLYEKIGPGVHPCHWCGKPVTWRTRTDTDRTNMLVVDHVDTDPRNNNPDNLVPSCSPCNTNRNRIRPKIVKDDELFLVDRRGWRHRAGRQVCEFCGVEFLAHLWRINSGEGRFCSLRCSGKASHAAPSVRSES